MSIQTRYLLPALAASLVALSSPAAHAQQRVDDATRAAARGIAEEALGRFDKGDYAGALVLFDKADALVHAPTMGLMAARCLQKLGRWVEAGERYLAVMQAKLDPGASDAQRQAQVSAEAERVALLPKIPAIVVMLEGATPEEARVTIDGNAVPPALIGLKRPTDPGRRRVEATRGADAASQEVSLKPGETKTITLHLAANATPKVVAAVPEHDEAGSKSTWRTIGWAAVGIGGASIVVGAITGGLAIAKRGSLDEKGCVGGMCPTSLEGDVAGYNALRMASGGTLIAGLVLAAGGVTLAVLAPKDAPKNRARVEPWIGLGSVGARGAF